MIKASINLFVFCATVIFFSNISLGLTVDVSNCTRNPASSAFHRWDCQSIEDCIRTESAPVVVNEGTLTEVIVSAYVPSNNCTPTTQSASYSTTVNTEFTVSYDISTALEATYAAVLKASVETTFGVSASISIGMTKTCNVSVPQYSCYQVYLASDIIKNRRVDQTVTHLYTRTDTMTMGINCECFTTCSSSVTTVATKQGDRVVTAPGCHWRVAPISNCCGE
jgi:hypothetical protein